MSERTENAKLVPEEILRRIQDHAAQISKPTPRNTHWRPPTVQDFRSDAEILCFDQSLSSSGWALLESFGGIKVRDSGTLRPEPLENGVRGFASTFSKSVGLAIQLREILENLKGQFDQVVLELPSVVGYRTESSLVAAAIICVTLEEFGQEMPVFVSRQSAGAVLCGDRHTPKNLSGEFVNGLVGDRHPTGKGQWTEHVRDAVFVGLRNLHQESR